MKLQKVKNTARKAFSLLELLIVILIVSTVYYMGFGLISLPASHSQILTPLKLKQTVKSLPSFHGKGELLCTNACAKCYFSEGISSPFKAINVNPKLGTKIRTYVVNAEGNLEETNYGRYEDEEICLYIKFFKNGSSTPFILENEHAVYYFPSYFGNPVKTASLEDARKKWTKNSEILKYEGNIY